VAQGLSAASGVVYVSVAELRTFKRVQDPQVATLGGFVVAVLRDDQGVS
jgi:hypothetical protein